MDQNCEHRDQRRLIDRKIYPIAHTDDRVEKKQQWGGVCGECHKKSENSSGNKAKDS